MERYRIVNKLTITDYMTAALFQLCKPVLQIAYLAIAFLLSWLICGDPAGGYSLTPSILFCMLGFFIFIQLGAIVMFGVSLKKNNDALFKSLEYRYTEITGESLTESYAANTSEVKWEKFLKISEFGNRFLLYTEKNKYVILPGRSMPEGCVRLLRRMATKLKDKPSGLLTSKAEDSPAGEGDIHIQITSRDYFAYQIYHTYVFRKNILLSSALMLLFAAVLYVLSYTTGQYLYPEVFLIILAVMCVFPIPIAYISSRKENAQKHIVIRIRENGLESENPFGKVLVKWEKLYSARQTKRYFFLYLSGTNAVVLPKRDLDAVAAGRISEAIGEYNLKAKKNRA